MSQVYYYIENAEQTIFVFKAQLVANRVMLPLHWRIGSLSYIPSAILDVGYPLVFGHSPKPAWMGEILLLSLESVKASSLF